MSAIKADARWPVPELVLLVLFPVPFRGPNALQAAYGHLPELAQFSLPLIVAAFIAVSATRLAVRAHRTKLTTRMVFSAICALLGAFATAFATLVLYALGAGPRAFAFTAVGIVLASLAVFANDIWILSARALRGSERRHP